MTNNIPLYNSIAAYIVTVVALYAIKPKIVYDEYHKEFKQFGGDEGETLFTVPVLALVAGVTVYVLSATSTLLNKNRKISKTNSPLSCDYHYKQVVRKPKYNRRGVWRVVM